MSLVLSFAGKCDYIPNDTASSLGAVAQAMASDIFQPESGRIRTRGRS
jgi:hypothetical protein